MESARSEENDETKTITDHNPEDCQNTERLREEASLKIPPVEKEAEPNDFLMDLLMSKSLKGPDLTNDRKKQETFDDDVVESASQVSGPVSDLELNSSCSLFDRFNL